MTASSRPGRYQWPRGYRRAAVLSFDFDAESGFLFRAMHRESGCFVLTCHPFVIGRASRIALLEDLVRFMRARRGVWFTTCEEVAMWHAKGGGQPTVRAHP